MYDTASFAIKTAATTIEPEPPGDLTKFSTKARSGSASIRGMSSFKTAEAHSPTSYLDGTDSSPSSGVSRTSRSSGEHDRGPQSSYDTESLVGSVDNKRGSVDTDDPKGGNDDLSRLVVPHQATLEKTLKADYEGYEGVGEYSRRDTAANMHGSSTRGKVNVSQLFYCSNIFLNHFISF